LDASVTKAELLEALATKAAELGVEAPSQTKLESWINKKLFQGAAPKGRQRGISPNWAYTSDAVTAALECLKLESLGAKRVTQLRIGLAIAGCEVATHLLRRSLKSEGLRSIKRMRRAGWRNYIPFNDVTDADIRRASQADPSLKETGLVPPPEALLSVVAMAMSGTGIPKEALDNLVGFLPSMMEKLIPDCPENLKNLLLEFMVSTQGMMAGIMGLPDETDAGLVAKVDCATGQEIEKALRIYRKFSFEFPEDPVFKALIDEQYLLLVGQVFRSIEFQPLLLVLQMSAVKNAPGWTQEML
jgi:hypothetical protein